MTTQIDPVFRPRHEAWISVPIILICLLGGGSIIRWYQVTDPAAHETKLLGERPVPLMPSKSGSMGNRPTRRVRGTIKANRNGSWTIHIDAANADFSVSTHKVELTAAVYNNYLFVPIAARNTITGLRTILSDNNRITQLKFTRQQVAQLRKLNSRITMNISPPDVEELCRQMTLYTGAADTDRPAIEPRLEQLLADVAERSTEPTIQQAQDRATQINAIITPEQWKLNESIGTGK